MRRELSPFNRSHQETEWDFELLTTELLDLRDLDMDLHLTGFEMREHFGALNENLKRA